MWPSYSSLLLLLLIWQILGTFCSAFLAASQASFLTTLPVKLTFLLVLIIRPPFISELLHVLFSPTPSFLQSSNVAFFWEYNSAHLWPFCCSQNYIFPISAFSLYITRHLTIFQQSLAFIQARATMSSFHIGFL